jgi:hypothetical protein
MAAAKNEENAADSNTPLQFQAIIFAPPENPDRCCLRLAATITDARR